MAREASRLIIRGRVQGVGYRWWAVGRARELGLAGWVRNRRDGSVETLVVGELTVVIEFIRACSKGPIGAEVTHVEVEAAADDGSVRFEQRETH